MRRARSTVTPDTDNVEALISAWELMVGRFPGHTIERSEGVATIFGHLPLSFFNLSVLDRPLVAEADFRRSLAVARERARACRHDSLVALCTAWAPGNLAELAAREGLTPSLNMTGMATDHLAPARREPPALDYRLVSDVATATDLATINAYAYGMPVEQVACLNNLHLWQEQSFGVVGYAAGRAVACAAAFVMADMIYIALVATLPDLHGRGLAEAVMRRAIRCAQDAGGGLRLWLHASNMGRPLYRSMGFESGAELPLFAFAKA